MYPSPDFTARESMNNTQQVRQAWNVICTVMTKIGAYPWTYWATVDFAVRDKETTPLVDL